MLDQNTLVGIDSASELAARLEELVGTGELMPGERLPPIRRLADRLDLAPTTVAAAIRRLTERGVVVTRGRRGTFVAEPPRYVLDPPVPEGLVDLATGNPDPELLPDLSGVVGRLRHPHVLYGDPPVAPELEAAARRWLPDHPVLAEAPLAVVGGALDGVERILAAQLRSGDRVAVEAPGWPAFTELLVSNRLEPVAVEIDDRGMLPAALEEVVGSVAAVLVTTRVQNPTGAAVDATRAAALAEVLAAEPRVLVVEDDHAGFLAGVPLAPIGPGRDRWALVQSSSKSFGPDLRCAVVYGDPTTVRLLRTRQAAAAGWVSHLLQRTLAALLDDPATARMLERAQRTYDRRRQAMLAALEAVGIEATGRTGLNVWAWVDDEQAAMAAAAEAGFALRAGERWRMGTAPAVRITTSRLEPATAPEVAAAVARATGGIGIRSA